MPDILSSENGVGKQLPKLMARLHLLLARPHSSRPRKCCSFERRDEFVLCVQLPLLDPKGAAGVTVDAKIQSDPLGK